MKRPLILIFSIFLTLTCFGQEKYETYPKNLVVYTDSFALRWGNESIDRYILKSDSMNFNGGALAGAYVILYYNNDSIKVKYKNKLPYGQYTYFNLISNTKKKTIRLGFDAQPSIFTKKYMVENSGKVKYDIPEVYELANIIWTLSPSGNKAKDINKESNYYKELLAYFKPYLNHPIFKSLDIPDSLYFNSYYNFRENSFAFNFKNSISTNLLYNGPYYYVYGDEYADSSLFGKLKPLVEDFANKTNFKAFYKKNIAYYREQIKRENELLPIKQMWNWLEIQFPNTKYNSYRIVFSPLIGASHSTQNYRCYNNNELFAESVMFICNTDRVDKDSKLTEKQKEALMSGIVFTEIDHNYVNPSTNKYRKQIDSIFSNRKFWVKSSNSSNYYDNPISVFNEYMTWSVFCLYIVDTYDEATSNLVINKREATMVDKRNFIKFKEFNQALLKIRQENKSLNVVDLYPFILGWCKQLL